MVDLVELEEVRVGAQVEMAEDPVVELEEAQEGDQKEMAEVTK